MKSRTRQFREVRDKNLSQTLSQVSQSSRFYPSNVHHNQFNQSRSSVFHKKDKVPVCVNCVNKKIIQQKRQKEQKNTEQQRLEIQQHMSEALLLKKQGKEFYQKTVRQVREYNKKQIKRHKVVNQTDKQLDENYIKQIEKNDKEVKKIQNQLKKLKKEKEIRYKQELKEQIEYDMIRKQSEKQQKIKTQPNQPLIPDHDRTELMLKYRNQLKKQMTQDQRRRELEKKQELQLQMESLKQNEEYLRYLPDKDRNSSNNPQKLLEMQKLQQKHRISKAEEREKKAKDRKQELIRNKQEYERRAKEELQKMRKYADQLTIQMNKQKRQQQQAKKRSVPNEKGSYLYTEQVMAASQVKKPCGECHTIVDQEILSYY